MTSPFRSPKAKVVRNAWILTDLLLVAVSIYVSLFPLFKPVPKEYFDALDYAFEVLAIVATFVDIVLVYNYFRMPWVKKGIRSCWDFDKTDYLFYNNLRCRLLLSVIAYDWALAFIGGNDTGFWCALCVTTTLLLCLPSRNDYKTCLKLHLRL